LAIHHVLRYASQLHVTASPKTLYIRTYTSEFPSVGDWEGNPRLPIDPHKLFKQDCKVSWEQVASPPMARPTPHTTPNCSSDGSRTNAQLRRKLPICYNGRPHTPPPKKKVPLSVDRSPNRTTYLIHGPIRPTIPNRIHIRSTVLPHAPDRQTNTETNR